MKQVMNGYGKADILISKLLLLRLQSLLNKVPSVVEAAAACSAGSFRMLIISGTVCTVPGSHKIWGYSWQNGIIRYIPVMFL